MSSPIRTRIHILASNVDPKTNQFGRDNKIVQDMMKAASFVIDRDVVALVNREDAKKSVKALVEAGLWKLPFNPMVIEYETDGGPEGKAHSFVYLYEKGEDIIGRVVLMELGNFTAMCAIDEMTARILNKEIMVDAGRYEKQSNPAHKLFLHTFAVSVHLALLMLNTKGIEKEVVHVPPSFNKKRVAKGRASIPSHTVVHIGTIYRRDGSAIKRDGHGGWHMPMHWRCGYTRRQHFGKNREEEKMVYIPPCIVNFKPDEDTPHAPMRKLKV